MFRNMTTPTLDEIIDDAITARLKTVNTAIPCIIEKYDAKQRRAEIKPQIQHLFDDGTFQPMPVINDVPVYFPNGGGVQMSFPVKKGDNCLAIFTQRSIDEWLSGGGDTKPRDPRTHGFSDAICFVGIDPFTETKNDNGDDFAIKFGSGEFRIAKNGDITMSSGNGKITVDSTGNIKLDGTTIAMGNTIAELVGIVASMALDLSTSVCPPNGPLSNAASFAIYSGKLNAVKGSL